MRIRSTFPVKSVRDSSHNPKHACFLIIFKLFFLIFSYLFVLIFLSFASQSGPPFALLLTHSIYKPIIAGLSLSNLFTPFHHSHFYLSLFPSFFLSSHLKSTQRQIEHDHLAYK